MQNQLQLLKPLTKLSALGEPCQQRDHQEE
jgi:hypothetical protein